MNKDQSKLYGLDHLRALAILLVWFFHYQGGTINDLLLLSQPFLPTMPPTL